MFWLFFIFLGTNASAKYNNHFHLFCFNSTADIILITHAFCECFRAIYWCIPVDVVKLKLCIRIYVFCRWIQIRPILLQGKGVLLELSWLVLLYWTVLQIQNGFKQNSLPFCSLEVYNFTSTQENVKCDCSAVVEDHSLLLQVIRHGNEISARDQLQQIT